MTTGSDPTAHVGSQPDSGPAPPTNRPARLTASSGSSSSARLRCVDRAAGSAARLFAASPPCFLRWRADEGPGRRARDRSSSRSPRAARCSAKGRALSRVQAWKAATSWPWSIRPTWRASRPKSRSRSAAMAAMGRASQKAGTGGGHPAPQRRGPPVAARRIGWIISCGIGPCSAAAADQTSRAFDGPVASPAGECPFSDRKRMPELPLTVERRLTSSLSQDRDVSGHSRCPGSLAPVSGLWAAESRPARVGPTTRMALA